MKIFTKQFMQDPYLELAHLRSEHAAVPVENNGFRMWVVTRYDDVRNILADRAVGKDLVKHRRRIVQQTVVREDRRAKLPRALGRSMLDQDGSDHRRLRGLVTRYFTPKQLDAFRPRIEAAADRLLDSLPVGEPVDFITAYARPFSADCVSELLGVPEGSRDGFPEWDNAILTGTSIEEIEEAGRKIYDFANQMIELKRAEPQDDIITELVRAGANGALDDIELVSMVVLMLVAGLEPASALSSGMLILLNHPDQLSALRAEPALLPDAVDEILRYETPFRMLTPRRLDEPMYLDGVTIPAGELLLICTGSANRDPDRFADPDRFDIRRCPKGHLGFSHGAHKCLGSALGKMESAIGLEKLLTRFREIKLAVPPDSVAWRPGTSMRRLHSLPLIMR